MGSDDTSKANFGLRIISIAVVIALIVGAGAGYMVGNSPVSSLMEEIDQLEAERDSLYLALQSLAAELDSNQELLVEEQRDVALLEQRYMEMLVIDQENLALQQYVMDLESQVADLETEKSIHEQEIKDYEATQSASVHILSIYESQVLSLREELENLNNTYRRALENCMMNRRWEVFAIYTGTANASGELHFTTGDILIRAGEVKLDIRTYSNRYEFLEVEMRPVGRGYTAYNLPWIYDSYTYEKLSTDPFPYNRIYGYENIDYGEIYQLEITGRYTDELIRKLDAGMTVEEDLYQDYDYMIKISIPEDS